MKEYKRKCPVCKTEIKYKKYKFFWQAIKRSSTCKLCLSHTLSISKMGKNNPMYGKHFSEEAKLKQRLSHIGKKPYEMTDEVRKRISESQMGRRPSKNAFRKDNIPWNKGMPQTEEVKRINRTRQLTRLKLLGILPNEDVGCKKYLQEINERGFDFKPKSFWNLGYIADGYDEKQNIWIEFDTPYHNHRYQQKKDLIRQQNIINYFEDLCRPLKSFIRIKADKTGKVLHMDVVYGETNVL